MGSVLSDGSVIIESFRPRDGLEFTQTGRGLAVWKKKVPKDEVDGPFFVRFGCMFEGMALEAVKRVGGSEFVCSAHDAFHAGVLGFDCVERGVWQGVLDLAGDGIFLFASSGCPGSPFTGKKELPLDEFLALWDAYPGAVEYTWRERNPENV